MEKRTKIVSIYNTNTERNTWKKIVEYSHNRCFKIFEKRGGDSLKRHLRVIVLGKDNRFLVRMNRKSRLDRQVGNYIEGAGTENLIARNAALLLPEGKLRVLLRAFGIFMIECWIDKSCCIWECECMYEKEKVFEIFQNRQFSCSDKCLNSRDDEESL